MDVSAPTLQTLWNKHGLGRRDDRLLKPERQACQHKIELTAEQVAWIEHANPFFRERHVASSRPGEQLCADTFFVGARKGVGKVYLHTVVDTYGSNAFGDLHTSTQLEAAALVLHNDVLPFYQPQGAAVEAVLTDHGREFCGTEAYPYELYLTLNDIEHRRTQVRSSVSNPSGVWNLKDGTTKKMIGRAKVTQGIRPGAVAFALGWGHFASGARDIPIDGEKIAGHRRRGSGIHANTAMRIDPVLQNVTLTGLVGGSAMFCDTKVKVQKA